MTVEMADTPEPEVLFAQKVANPEKKIRDKALKQLSRYLSAKSQSQTGLTLEDALKLWKGLFYCMYLADKPLIQEDLADKITQLLFAMGNDRDRLNFLNAGFLTFAREWNGIDVFRIDKFMMMVRRLVRQMFHFVSECDWLVAKCCQLAEILESSIVCPTDNINAKPQGLKLHLCDILLEEMSKAGGEQLPHAAIVAFLNPFIKVLAVSSLDMYKERVIERIFRHLIRQSDLGIEHEMQQVGLAIDDEELGTDEEEETEIKDKDEPTVHSDIRMALDPRAGGVDVCLPQLQLDYGALAETVQSVASIPTLRKQNRSLLYQLVVQLKDLIGGLYPLGMSQIKGGTGDPEIPEAEVKAAIWRLQKFEEKINENGNDEDDEVGKGVLTHRNIKKKKRRAGKKSTTDSSIQLKKKQKKTKVKENKMVLSMIDSKLKSSIGVVVESVNLDKTQDHQLSLGDVSDLVKKGNGKGKKRKQEDIIVNAQKDILKKQGVIIKEKEVTKKKVKKVINPDEEVKKQEKFIMMLKDVKKQEKVIMKPEEVGIVKVEELKVERKKKIKSLSNETLETDVKMSNQAKKNKSSPNALWNVVGNTTPNGVKNSLVIGKDKKKRKKLSLSPAVKVKATAEANRRRSITIDLRKNREHEFSDYLQSVKKSPAIPFSSEKKPRVSLLKSVPRLTIKGANKGCSLSANSTPKKKKFSAENHVRASAADFF